MCVFQCEVVIKYIKDKLIYYPLLAICMRALNLVKQFPGT